MRDLLKRQSPAHLEIANSLLRFEGGSVPRVYDKLHEQLASLIGASSVRAIFARSVKLAIGSTFEFREGENPGKQLEECLGRQDQAVAAETAAAVVGNFVGVLEKLIGENLTRHVLSGAWPEVRDEKSAREPQK